MDKLLRFLMLLIGQSVVAYEPVSLMDNNGIPKYKIGIIVDNMFSSSNFYKYWIPTLKSNYGSSEEALWQSFAPSAMVDPEGSLYTISFERFTDYTGDSAQVFPKRNGPVFKIWKGKINNGTVQTSSTRFQPWEEIKVNGITAQLNCTASPSFEHEGINTIVAPDMDKDFFKKYVHNVFMPCLAQEITSKNDLGEPLENISSSDYLYGFVSTPPTRLMGVTNFNSIETASSEGMLFFKIPKNLSTLTAINTNYIPHKDYSLFAFNMLRQRDIGCYQPQYGNLTAYYNGSQDQIYLWSLYAPDLTYNPLRYSVYRSTFDTSGAIKDFVEIAPYHWNRFLMPKVVRSGDYVYFMSPVDGVTVKIYQQSLTNLTDYREAIYMAGFQFLEWVEYDQNGEQISKHTDNAWTYSCFPFDFLVLDAGNNKKIVCTLGLQGINVCHKNPPQSRFDELKVYYLTQAQGWYGTESGKINFNENVIGETYCNFNCKNTSLILWASTLNGTSATYYREHASNAIYTINVQSSGATPADKTGSTGLSDKTKRLYLNTHKVCVYKNYIIYAYCYPGKDNGKGNHLYIGYAPYVLMSSDGTNSDTLDSTLTSDSRLRLLTKIEFKDENDNSFITDCDRIISLDCKNGHIWLTYMADVGGYKSSAYKYFYIKASDLVGE